MTEQRNQGGLIICYWAGSAGRHIFDSLKAKAMEWVASFAAFLFGFALVQPGSTFAISESYRTFAYTTTWLGISEELVGWSIITFAVIRLAILAYNGLWTSSPKARAWMAFSFAVMWFAIALGFFSAVGSASTGNTYWAWLFGEIINVARAGFENGKISRLIVLQKGKTIGDGSRN